MADRSSQGRFAAVVLVIAGTVTTVFGVAGSSRISGPVILRLWSSHGVHLDDLVVLACWVSVMVVAGRLWRQ